MSAGSRWLAVGAFFAALTVLATWPQVLHLPNAVKDPGDPLFNAWVLAWNAHKLGRLELADYFDANIFWPHRRTLAYSEHLFPQALLAAPILWATGNPVLAHNLILLFGFFTSALGMFALARHLTGATLPGLLAGVIYAFCPFMFSHLSHVQVLTAGGIPLSFLFLHRFLKQRRRRDALLFAAAFTLQVLANGYYALFLSLGVGLYLLIELPRRRLLLDRRTWSGLALAGALALALAGPFFRQYLLMQREMHFRRELATEVSLGSFLAAPRVNRLYGALTAPLRRPEAQLLPGLTPALLALLGALALARRGGPARRAERLLALVAGALALTAAAVAAVGPLALHPLLSVSSPLRPAMLAALLAAAAVLVRSFRKGAEDSSGVGVYAVLGLLAFTLTFGEKGPYWLLYRWVPGFDGVRAVPRIHVLTMLAVAVLAGWGAHYLLGRLHRGRTAAFAGVLALLAVEYASAPVPLADVAMDREERRLQRWIARATGTDDVLLELPLPPDEHEWWRIEPRRMVASAGHWRPLVNGFSGLEPPLYQQLRRRWREWPLGDNVAEARALGVRYLVVHQRRDGRPWAAGVRLAQALQELQGLRLVQALPQAWVFALEAEPLGPPHTGAPPPRAVPVRRVHASPHPELGPLAVDGRLATRWATGRPQAPGDTITLELGAPTPVAAVRLHLGPSPLDYPRGWSLSASEDGANWRELARGKGDALPLSAYLTPGNLQITIAFPPTAARLLRLTCTEGDGVYYWSVHEAEVLAPP